MKIRTTNKTLNTTLRKLSVIFEELYFKFPIINITSERPFAHPLIHSLSHSLIHPSTHFPNKRTTLKQAILCVPILLLITTACEERYQPDITTASSELVIEGHIEASEAPLPPYVILTRTIPFYATISADQIEDLFVHNALVQVSDGKETVILEEVCWNDLPEDLKSIVVETVPDLEDVNINYCVYTDLSFSLLGEIGKTYSLYIETDKEIATASTIIPEHSPLDSVYFVPAPGGFGDSLLEMRGLLNDPALSQQYYRYFSSTNNGPFYPAFNSVFSDRLFDGQEVAFPLQKGEPAYREEGAGIFGLYRPGDEVVLRWTSIDEAHYKFWDTLEFNRVNQGPFGSYTQVKSNVEGAIGIWGGYSGSHYPVVAE